MGSIRKVEKAVDRISNIPDPILCEILSRLPTKNAVATSILSTRWKNLFPFGVLHIYLDLDDSLLLHPTKIECNPNSTSFSDFVDKLLNSTTLLDGPRVETMRLCYKGWGVDNKILSWVSAALRLNVRELILGVCLLDSDALFPSLNGCTTLVRLVLCLERMMVKFPDNISLPNLKSLEFSDLSLCDERGNSIEGLLDGCPALEDLNLIRLRCHVRDFFIRGPMLKNLTISEGSTFGSTYCFDLDTPNLQMLTCDCYAARGYRVSGFKSLFMANIDILPFDGADFVWFFDKSISDVVTACSSTARLYLGARSIDMLFYSSVQLPTFQNLTWLGLGSLSFNGWTILGRLLWRAPNLKELTFEEGFKTCVRCYEGSFMSAYEDFLWSASNSICLEFHLENIKFCVFNWTEDETDLLEYFLTNGKVLEKLTIRCRPSLDIATVNKLLLLPNHSKIVLESI